MDKTLSSIVLIALTLLKISSAFDLACKNDKLRTDYYYINEPIYDTDEDTNFQISSYGNCCPQGVRYGEVLNSKYSQLNDATYPSSDSFSYTIRQISEETEPSQANFIYNFTFNLVCHTYSNSQDVQVNVRIPLFDTNNHEPFFNKPVYKYDMISTFPEDFKRLQILHPIIATDYDVTNLGMLFSIEPNDYLDIEYGEIVPNSLQKKHTAILVLKKTPVRPIDLKIEATDKGFPPHTTTSRIIVNPPSPPQPVFEKSIYTGHYYKNDTFIMKEDLMLVEGINVYPTTTTSDCYEYFYPTNPTSQDNVIKIKQNNYVRSFYKNNYIACLIEAQYSDPKTGLSSTGKTVLIVEMHHDL